MKLESASEKSLFSTIRIETRLGHGEFVTGTAFVYEFATEDNTYPFLVTARNLIENAKEGRITLIQGQNRKPIMGKGYTLDIENFSKLWFCHPDESLNVAVTPFVPFVKHVENTGVTIYFETFSDKHLYPLNSEDAVKMVSDLVYLGYPQNCWDDKHLLPVVKSGILSLPYNVNFQGKPQGIIDTLVSQGSCGSPVFLKARYTDENIDSSLLGVLTNMPVKIVDKDGKVTFNEDARMETSMGLVIKMEVIIEAISSYLREKGFI